jgi:hypothetical protein
MAPGRPSTAMSAVKTATRAMTRPSIVRAGAVVVTKRSFRYGGDHRNLNGVHLNSVHDTDTMGS